ncbi:type II secretion system protein GspK [Pelagicoccus sp. SDUM812005]|uniref:general secretion pathway protein GspK n=1 Tax=Pelagicoccus sp. SDUM812005 TaxID=3041257 RepID=UPI00280D82E5|nr:type II secretion system protein GspK [Pelagicoccus sp. SDUM812005]MDQ8181813.1 type II secretion system protein GspK [Pelagicoccus sp. SDUM812005]
MKGAFPRKRQGSILLLVLVLIVVVSFALTMFIEKAQVEIKGEGYYVKRAELRKEAWSMMEVAVAVLADVKAIDTALYSPSQGWGDPLEYANVSPREGLDVRFEFIDESGKVNINTLDRDSLILLFDELGFDLEISSRLSDVLLDWIDGDDETRIEGAESREYSSLELDVRPANQELKSLDELRYLFGFQELFFDESGAPLPVFRQLEQAVSIYEVTSLNVNAASSLALRAIADLDEFDKQAIDEFLKGFDGQLGTSDDNYFATADDVAAVLVDIPEGAPLGFQISVLTIKVTVSEGGYQFTLIGTLSVDTEAPALEQSGGNLSYPFLFLDLREQPGSNNARPL